MNTFTRTARALFAALMILLPIGLSSGLQSCESITDVVVEPRGQVHWENVDGAILRAMNQSLLARGAYEGAAALEGAELDEERLASLIEIESRTMLFMMLIDEDALDGVVYPAEHLGRWDQFFSDYDFAVVGAYPEGSLDHRVNSRTLEEMRRLISAAVTRGEPPQMAAAVID